MSTNNSSPSGTPPYQPNISSISTSSSLYVPTSNQIPTPPTITINPPSLPQPTLTTINEAASRPGSNRYNPPVPSRMTGTYSSNNSIYHNNLAPTHNAHGRRLGTSSASSSPPGTPPNGLRDYYLNVALQRAQHRFYTHGTGSGPNSANNSSTNLSRPNISVVVPSQSKYQEARRAYSADQLSVQEPQITVTTPGGSNETEEHVKTLQNALNNLIAQESRAAPHNDDDDAEDPDTDGPIMMKGNKSNSVPGTVSAGRKSGVLLTPTVLANREDPEKTAAGTMSHGIVGSDVTLSDKDQKEKERKAHRKSHNRISRLFGRDVPGIGHTSDQHYHMQVSRAPVQPSKAGVLSNLLKLQDNGRHAKECIDSSYTIDNKAAQGKEETTHALYPVR
ncbi:hypothetical protein BC939DRAFT_134803 [Gamsiella multidivaricata]|uniref:uncharacterized protein n=1 Tax=Gamsiella multidivaricata TaxID=101098 RepID=UPI0022211CB7|nr:uncharacterized protein BC939DRAFT_134803 [Gamsiella multidivaricata]KAI7824781.1 hypothetical protein BC939DRAFT_134803 [Gamsiella multidivaricata]